jgi:hypothetical protein
MVPGTAYGPGDCHQASFYCQEHCKNRKNKHGLFGKRKEIRTCSGHQVARIRSKLERVIPSSQFKATYHTAADISQITT